MISEKRARMYCYEIEKIENYDKAITDMKHTWHCHHRLEIGANGEVVSRDQLDRHGLYYNRPASELIFLTHSEHMKLHHMGTSHPLHGKNLSDETCRKISEAKKGKKRKPFTEEHLRKMREAQRARWAKKKMTKE